MAERDYLTPGSSSPASAQSAERSPDEIRQQIAATRESITQTVDRLSDRVHAAFDWHTYVANHPLVAVGAAACVGILVSGFFRRRPTPGERIADAVAETIEDVSERFRERLDVVGVGRPGLREALGAAATGLVVKAATELVRNKLAQAAWEESDLDDPAVTYDVRR
ncbi:MAG TPA: DUF3618 domain-containing protein [Blastocatellia bacterium]|nr:DUF3618 domain-containing protein [Blastocatellia bacterium]